MSKGLNIDGKVTNEQRNREWKNFKVPFTSHRSLCIADAPLAREIQGRSSAPQIDFACSCT